MKDVWFATTEDDPWATSEYLGPFESETVALVAARIKGWEEDNILAFNPSTLARDERFNKSSFEKAIRALEKRGLL